ncbi:hypothetical protein KIW84_044050 [Lathyrus oleraceus]|uniref:Uncharacterized protein n=1 Tax=Pisum sativum TaxID=3888 RepID=A0A9D5AUX0_PEA|nr:hypothetical protein KIW84_044050 [Pisum sativum]
MSLARRICSLQRKIYKRNLVSWNLGISVENEKTEDGAEALDNPVTSESADEVSAFPLEHCMRILPHDQNTGALFIAITIEEVVKAVPEENMIDNVSNTEDLEVSPLTHEEQNSEETKLPHNAQDIAKQSASVEIDDLKIAGNSLQSHQYQQQWMSIQYPTTAMAMMQQQMMMYPQRYMLCVHPHHYQAPLH